MRSLLIVVSDLLPQGPLKVTFAQDENVVQTLMPDGFHEAFGKSVCHRRAYRGADDADAFRAKDLLKRPRVLGVTVADQEPGSISGRMRLSPPGAGQDPHEDCGQTVTCPG